MTVPDDLARLKAYADRIAFLEAEIARLESQLAGARSLERDEYARAEAAEAEAARLRDGLESADRLLRAVPIDRLAPVTKRIVGEARAAIALVLLADDGAAL